MILFVGEETRGFFVDEVAISHNQTVKYTGFVCSVRDMLQKALEEYAEYIIINAGDPAFPSDDISEIVSRIRDTAGKSTIIVMAQGYSEHSNLVTKCRNAGIQYFLLSSLLSRIKEELNAILNGKNIEPQSAEKESVSSATVERASVPNSSFPATAIVQQSVKTIAIGGCINRIGTTTQCLQVAKYLQSIGKRVCYIEFNNSKYLSYLENNYLDRTYRDGMLLYANLPLIKKEQIENVLKNNKYDYYIYDYGVVSNLEERVRASFLEKKKKIIVCGNSPSELEALGEIMDDFLYSDVDYIFSFISDSEKSDVQEMMSDKASRVYFSNYSPDPFSFFSSSISCYAQILDVRNDLEQEPNKSEKKTKKRRKSWLFGGAKEE